MPFHCPPLTAHALLCAAQVRRIVLCTGKVYYDLLNARADKGIDDVAITRVEQISPFPHDLVQSEVRKCSGAEVACCLPS